MTDPAGVQDAHKTVATAEEGVLAAEDGGGERFEDELEAAFAEALASSGTNLSAPPPSAGPSCSGTLASKTATVEARSGAHLLLLKLEVITTLYKNKHRNVVQQDVQLLLEEKKHNYQFSKEH